MLTDKYDQFLIISVILGIVLGPGLLGLVLMCRRWDEARFNKKNSVVIKKEVQNIAKLNKTNLMILQI